MYLARSTYVRGTSVEQHEDVDMMYDVNTCSVAHRACKHHYCQTTRTQLHLDKLPRSRSSRLYERPVPPALPRARPNTSTCGDCFGRKMYVSLIIVMIARGAPVTYHIPALGAWRRQYRDAVVRRAHFSRPSAYTLLPSAASAGRRVAVRGTVRHDTRDAAGT